MGTSTVAEAQRTRRFLVTSLMFIALVVAVVGSLGAPLITSVAASYRVPLSSAQWTLTITLLAGAIATPVLGRLDPAAGAARPSGGPSPSSWPAAWPPSCRCRSAGCWPAAPRRASRWASRR